MRFYHPQFLWLFLIYVPLIVWYVLNDKKSHPSLRLSSTSAFNGLGTSWKAYFRHFLFVVKLAAIGCLIIILCRPQSHSKWSTSETEGTDIVIALDVSTSMMSKDFRPNRFEAAKDVASKFVSGRDNDEIGLVIFAGETFTQVPMTMDNATLVNAIETLQIGVLQDGTAIGDGIATSINRIRSGKAKSKSIILLTDGSNNTGQVAPITAAQIAQRFGIKIYTIGIGTNGTALTPVAINPDGSLDYQRLPVTIDEGTLRRIASITGGKYFRATGNSVLRQVFAEIDKLEKTRLDVQNFSHSEDYYEPWALLLLLLVVVYLLGQYVVLKRVP